MTELAHHFSRSSVFDAGLPESPVVASDEPDDFPLVGKVCFPQQRPVTKNPHDGFRTLSSL